MVLRLDKDNYLHVLAAIQSHTDIEIERLKE